MARILYSCCGEGRGHSSRTLTLARRLMERGHEVNVLASNAAYSALRPLLPTVTEIPGLVLVYDQNRIAMGRTLGENARTWRRQGDIVRSIEVILKSWQPDLAITDFEPFLPIAARRNDLPFIGIDHQHVIPGLKLPTPAKYWAHLASTLAIVHLTYKGEEANLVTSFFQPSTPYGSRYHYFGPILRDEIARLHRSVNNHVLVYQTSSSFVKLPSILKSLPFQFRIYAFNQEGIEANCMFKPRNHPDFFADLASCSWVLTNGGYTLISESLFLGKPVLSIPVSGQFEQWINAHHLQKLGFGAACEREAFTPEFVSEFSKNLDTCRHRISQDDFDGTEAIVDKALSYL